MLTMSKRQDRLDVVLLVGMPLAGWRDPSHESGTRWHSSGLGKPERVFQPVEKVSASRKRPRRSKSLVRIEYSRCARVSYSIDNPHCGHRSDLLSGSTGTCHALCGNSVRFHARTPDRHVATRQAATLAGRLLVRCRDVGNTVWHYLFFV
jgi:hypothetical protein